MRILFNSIQERIGTNYKLIFVTMPRYTVWVGSCHIESKTIYLNRREMQYLSVRGIREVIIHELAHAWLGMDAYKHSHDKVFVSTVKKLGGVLTGKVVGDSPLYYKVNN